MKFTGRDTLPRVRLAVPQHRPTNKRGRDTLPRVRSLKVADPPPINPGKYNPLKSH